MSAHLNVNQHLNEVLKNCLKSTGTLVKSCSHAENPAEDNCNQGMVSDTGALNTVPGAYVKHSRVKAERIAASDKTQCNAITSGKSAHKETSVNAKGSGTIIPAATANSGDTQPRDESNIVQAPGAEVSTTNMPEEKTSSQIKKAPNMLKRTAVVSLLLVLLLASGIAGKNLYEHMISFQETEDAYVTGHLHQISSRVNGTVQEVLIDDNDHVKAGQPLVLLDPKDFQIKIDAAKAELKQARQQVKVASSTVVFADVTEKGSSTNAQGSVSEALASIAGAEAAVSQAQSQIGAARADLKAKEAELDRAKSDLTRYETLLEQGAVSTQQRDFALRDFKVAQENFNVSKDQLLQAVAGLAKAQQVVHTAKAQLVQSQAQVQMAKASSVQTVINQNQHDVALAAVDKAQAALDEAEQNLKYTVIPAPTSGRVGNKTVEVGQRINPGQAILSIVSDKPWVVANFKETQLSKMKVGQPVKIEIDSFPDHEFEGRIESFAPASGASFSIIRSDNATGNFTKIVQRVPVKIIISSESAKGYEDRIVPGMSVVAKVQVKSQDSNSGTRVAHAGY